MIEICVVTRWITVAGVMTPEVMTLYPAAWADYIGLPCAEITPDPNATMCIGYVTQAQADALEADARAFVMWSREAPTP